MKVVDLLTTLHGRNIQVWPEGEHLRCSAPPGALSTALRDELRQRKQELLEFLRAAGSLATQQHAIIPLQPHGTRPPVFAVAGHNGDVFCFRALARHLGADQPFYGLQPPGLDGRREPLARLEDLAAYFAAEIRAFQPNGPYLIAGYCAGGTPAFELARQLLRDGAALSGLALFGSPFPTWYHLLPQLRERWRRAVERLIRHAGALASLSAAACRVYIGERWRNLNAERAGERRTEPDPVLVWRDNVGRATLGAIRRYVPGPFEGRVSLFWPSRNWRPAGRAPAQWRAVAPHIETYFGPEGCDGATMLREPYVAAFADLFRQSMRTAQKQSLLLKPNLLSAPSPLSDQQVKALPF